MNSSRVIDPSDGAAKARIHHGRSVQSIALAAACRLFMKNAVRIWGLTQV